jgi:hypothetical protein
MDEYSIVLDCAPGTPRPDSHFPGVIEGSGLEVSDFRIVSKSFGAWTWELKDGPKVEEKKKLYDAAKGQFKTRITRLYDTGRIRYGEW